MHATVRLPGRSAHLPMESPKDAANPMRPCSDTFLLMDFQNFSAKFKTIPTEFNATTQKNIIL